MSKQTPAKSKALAIMTAGLKDWQQAALMGKRPPKKALSKLYAATVLISESPRERQLLADLIGTAQESGAETIQGVPVVFAVMLLQGGLPHVD